MEAMNRPTLVRIGLEITWDCSLSLIVWDRLPGQSSLGSIPSELQVKSWMDPKLTWMENDANPLLSIFCFTSEIPLISELYLL